MNKFLAILAAALMTGSMSAGERLLLDSVVTSTERGLSEKEVYVYDDSGKSTHYNVYNYNNGAWVLTKEYQLEHVYSTGQLLMTRQNLNTGSGWVLMSRVDYTYDAEGRVATEIAYSHSAAGSSWNEMSRNTYHYDAAGQVDTLFHEMWASGAWEPYTTMVTTAESCAMTRIMDRYWTGYEDEGVDGQMIFYYSQYDVTALPSTSSTTSRASKLLIDGRLVLIRAGLRYDALGRRL